MTPKRVLVTGASKGIGRAIARHLATRHARYRVFGTSRSPSSISAPVPDVAYFPLDLSDPRSIAACTSALDPIDILINNAGRSQIGPAEAYSVQRTRALLEINLLGHIQLIQAFLPGMRRRRDGMILNIGSLVSRFPVPFQSSYAASKSALAAYGWALRNEVSDFNIRVILVEPGDVHTSIAPELVAGKARDYHANLGRFKKTRQARMKAACHPDKVARHVGRILDKKTPKAFYAAGDGAALMTLAARILPGRLVEALTRKHYGLF